MTTTPEVHRETRRTIRIPDDEWREARIIAAAEGRAVSEIVRELLYHYTHFDSYYRDYVRPGSTKQDG